MPLDNSSVMNPGDTELSPRQLEMISDNSVTFAEYEEAYFAHVQCIKDQGISVRSGPKLDAHGIRYETSFSAGDYNESAKIIEECEVRHLLSVLQLRTSANRPSEALLQEAQQALRACLADRSIEMPPHLTGDDFGALLSAAASGEGRVPAGRSLDEISEILAQHPDAGALFFEFLDCRERVGEQYPVGW